jgi:hypothetical protein
MTATKTETQSKPKATQKEKTKSKPRRDHVWVQTDDRLFTLEIKIIDGAMTDNVYKTIKKVSRRIEMRGDDLLDSLHEAIFKAFDRFDPHLCEFRVGGKNPMDSTAKRYVHPIVLEENFMGMNDNAKDMCVTTIGSLGLKQGDTFFYWFDFGDDWWHSIKIVSIDDKAPSKKGYPKIVEKIGDSPPQYVDWNDEDDE